MEQPTSPPSEVPSCAQVSAQLRTNSWVGGPLLCSFSRCSINAAVLAFAVGAATPAAAADGCLVLLCLAAPSWRNIAQCVDPVRQALRDLARGRPFPSCAMSGSGNAAANRWSEAPRYCPPQYTRSVEGGNGPVYTCDYSGAVEVKVSGALWARTWWNPSGDSVTEFTPSARSRLGTWDSRFEDDYAAWLAAQPPPAPPAPVN